MIFKNRKLLQIYLLYFMGFMDLFAVGITVPLVVQHMKTLGASHFVIGLMSATYSGCQLFSGPMMGSLSDLKGRKEILILTILFCSTAYLLLGLFSSVVLLITLRILLGIFKQTQMLTKAIVADVCPSAEQSGVYGKLTAISGLGITIGPIVGGHISEDLQPHGFTTACAATSLLFMANAGLAHFLEKNKDDDNRSKVATGKKQVLTINRLIKISIDSVKLSIRDLQTVDWYCYWDIFILKAILGFGMGCYFSNYSMLLKLRYELSPKWIGYTISFQGVVTSLCSFFIQIINNFYKNDIDYSKRNFHGFVLMTVSFAGMIIAPTYVIYLVCLIPLAICSAVMRQIGLEMIIKRSSRKHRGSVIGASNSMRSLAGITAPLATGFLSDLYSVDSVLYASVVSCAIGVVLTMYIRLKSDIVNNHVKKRR